MHFSIAQANLPKMYLEYPPISCWFVSPHLALLSKPLYISMRRWKMYSLVHKAIRNRSIWVPCQFLMLAPNTLWKTYLSVCLETWKNLYGKHMEKWRILMEMWKILRKMKKKYIYIYGKMMKLTEKVKEFIWQKYGKMKNLYGNAKDFLRKNEKIYGKMTNSSRKVKEFIWSNGILSIGFLTSTVF